jgi:hypothetical protein
MREHKEVKEEEGRKIIRFQSLIKALILRKAGTIKPPMTFT